MLLCGLWGGDESLLFSSSSSSSRMRVGEADGRVGREGGGGSGPGEAGTKATLGEEETFFSFSFTENSPRVASPKCRDNNCASLQFVFRLVVVLQC